MQKFRTDNQFLDSANGISVFLEEKAMDAENRLRKPKALAVNKIGHAMHDLDPVFREFSRCAALRDTRRCLVVGGMAKQTSPTACHHLQAQLIMHCSIPALEHMQCSSLNLDSCPCRSRKMQALFRSLPFERPMPVQSMYICKQPHIGGEVVPHQDSTFLWCVSGLVAKSSVLSFPPIPGHK